MPGPRRGRASDHEVTDAGELLDDDPVGPQLLRLVVVGQDEDHGREHGGRWNALRAPEPVDRGHDIVPAVPGDGEPFVRPRGVRAEVAPLEEAGRLHGEHPLDRLRGERSDGREDHGARPEDVGDRPQGAPLRGRHPLQLESRPGELRVLFELTGEESVDEALGRGGVPLGVLRDDEKLRACPSGQHRPILGLEVSVPGRRLDQVGHARGPAPGQELGAQRMQMGEPGGLLTAPLRERAARALARFGADERGPDGVGAVGLDQRGEVDPADRRDDRETDVRDRAAGAGQRQQMVHQRGGAPPLVRVDPDRVGGGEGLVPRPRRERSGDGGKESPSDAPTVAPARAFHRPLRRVQPFAPRALEERDGRGRYGGDGLAQRPGGDLDLADRPVVRQEPRVPLQAVRREVLDLEAPRAPRHPDQRVPARPAVGNAAQDPEPREHGTAFAQVAGDELVRGLDVQTGGTGASAWGRARRAG